MADRITPQVARVRLAQTSRRWVTMFKHGLLELEYYAPIGTDPQEPHTRDEVYFVLTGQGWFVMDGQRQAFGPGEVIFAPAGVPHHFEDFSQDFATWAIFSGKPRAATRPPARRKAAGRKARKAR